MIRFRPSANSSVCAKIWIVCGTNQLARLNCTVTPSPLALAELLSRPIKIDLPPAAISLSLSRVGVAVTVTVLIGARVSTISYVEARMSS